MAPDEATGLVLICDPQGTILECWYDDIGLDGLIGKKLSDIVDVASRDKAQNFLATLRAEQIAFDWQLNLFLNRELLCLHFNGVVEKEKILVLGLTSLADSTPILETLMRFQNDQQNTLRLLIKALTGYVQQQNRQSRNWYEEFSRLTTDLVNVQRELTKRNVQLERVVQENARLYAEAEEALEARISFLSSIAHDLKSPLTTIRGYAQLLRRRLIKGRVEPERVATSLTRIDRAAHQMSRQINQLLDVARLQSGQTLELEKKPTDLVALLRQVVGDLLPVRDPRWQIQLNGADRPLIGHWDPMHLERILANLLSNALKYSPSGGVIHVELALLERQGVPWAAIKVADPGMGIAAEELPFVFDLFRRSADVPGEIAGSGIGLASARYSVEQHGGEISIASELGEGTTVQVLLPCPCDR
jgi:signal transduction histidine kinase